MSDDILTRLHRAVCWCNDFDGRCDKCEAVAEIERLRVELRNAEQLRDHLRTALEVQIGMSFPTHTAQGALDRANSELGGRGD